MRPIPASLTSRYLFPTTEELNQLLDAWNLYGVAVYIDMDTGDE